MWENLQSLSFSVNFEDYVLADDTTESSIQLIEAEIVLEMLCEEGTNVPKESVGSDQNDLP